MGVKVDRSTAGWEISVTPMELTVKGKEIFGQSDMVSREIYFPLWKYFERKKREIGG